MKKYNFNKIETDILMRVVNSFNVNGGLGCGGIDCHICPISNFGGCCAVGDNKKRHNILKEELNRREKDMNEMPELKAGMILEFKTSMGQKKLYINDSWIMSLTNDTWTSFYGLMTRNEIENIYVSNAEIKTYIDCTKDIKLIWSKKSDKDIEIEEIQKEMDKLNKRMEGLKSDN